MNKKKTAQHEMQASARDGTLLIPDLQNAVAASSFLLLANGQRYADYGIADHSMLLCNPELEPEDGDLVVAHDDGLKMEAVFLYRPDAAKNCEGKKHLISNRSQVKAVIVTSMNFYR